MEAQVKEQRIGIPAVMMCLYFLLLPTSLLETAMGFSILKVMSIVVAAVCIVMLFVGDNEIKLNSTHLIWAVYMIYSVSTLFFGYTDIAWTTFRALLEITALGFLMSIRVYNEREKKMIFDTWVIVGIFMIGLMLFSSSSMDSGSRDTVAFFGQEEDPNGLCGYFILPLLIAMERLSKKGEKFRVRAFYFAIVLGIIYSVVRSGSRGGLIAILVTAVLYLLLNAASWTNKILIIAVVAVMCLITVYLILPLMPESLLERFSIDRIMEDRATGRFTIWEALMSDWARHPSSWILGNGYYSTADIIQTAGVDGITVAHNHIIQLLYDQGIIGCVMFMLVLVSAALRMYRRKNTRILALALVGGMALGMSITLYAYYKPFWNILIMTALNFEGGVSNAKG